MNREYDPHTRHQPRNQKRNRTSHTTNTEEDHITQDNKLIKIHIIKTRIIGFTRRIQMQEIFYGPGYQDESLVSNKSNKQSKSKD